MIPLVSSNWSQKYVVIRPHRFRCVDWLTAAVLGYCAGDLDWSVILHTDSLNFRLAQIVNEGTTGNAEVATGGSALLDSHSKDGVLR